MTIKRQVVIALVLFACRDCAASSSGVCAYHGGYDED